MTEKLKKEILDILDNVYYREAFTQEYNDRIDAVKKQLNTPVVSCNVEEAINLLKYYEEKCFHKVNGKSVLVSDEHLQKYNIYKNWLDNRELHYR